MIHAIATFANTTCFINLSNGSKTPLTFDELVFIGARTPDDKLEIELANTDIKLYKAGDCLSPGIIQAAVLSGHSVARSIVAGENVLLQQNRDQLLL